MLANPHGRSHSVAHGGASDASTAATLATNLIATKRTRASQHRRSASATATFSPLDLTQKTPSAHAAIASTLAALVSAAASGATCLTTRHRSASATPKRMQSNHRRIEPGNHKTTQMHRDIIPEMIREDSDAMDITAHQTTVCAARNLDTDASIDHCRHSIGKIHIHIDKPLSTNTAPVTHNTDTDNAILIKPIRNDNDSITSSEDTPRNSVLSLTVTDGVPTSLPHSFVEVSSQVAVDVDSDAGSTSPSLSDCTSRIHTGVVDQRGIRHLASIDLKSTATTVSPIQGNQILPASSQPTSKPDDTHRIPDLLRQALDQQRKILSLTMPVYDAATQLTQACTQLRDTITRTRMSQHTCENLHESITQARFEHRFRLQHIHSNRLSHHHDHCAVNLSTVYGEVCGMSKILGFAVDECDRLVAGVESRGLGYHPDLSTVDFGDAKTSVLFTSTAYTSPRLSTTSHIDDISTAVNSTRSSRTTPPPQSKTDKLVHMIESNTNRINTLETQLISLRKRDGDTRTMITVFTKLCKRFSYYETWASKTVGVIRRELAWIDCVFKMCRDDLVIRRGIQSQLLLESVTKVNDTDTGTCHVSSGLTGFEGMFDHIDIDMDKTNISIGSMNRVSVPSMIRYGVYVFVKLCVVVVRKYHVVKKTS